MFLDNASGLSAQQKPISASDADEAWQAYAALRRAAQCEPHLATNEYFTALQDTAFARFMLVFEAMEVRP